MFVIKKCYHGTPKAPEKFPKLYTKHIPMLIKNYKIKISTLIFLSKMLTRDKRLKTKVHSMESPTKGYN